jgi:hypothetical protein
LGKRVQHLQTFVKFVEVEQRIRKAEAGEEVICLLTVGLVKVVEVVDQLALVDLNKGRHHCHLHLRLASLLGQEAVVLVLAREVETLEQTLEPQVVSAG